MKVYLVVFDPAEGEVDLSSVVLALEEAELHTFDRNVLFLKTSADIDAVVAALRRSFDGREFFATEVNAGRQGGYMMPGLWDFLSVQPQLSTAA